MAQLKNILLVVSGSDAPPLVASTQLIDYIKPAEVEQQVLAVGWRECTTRQELHLVLDQTLDALEALPTKNDGPYSDEPDMV